LGGKKQVRNAWSREAPVASEEGIEPVEPHEQVKNRGCEAGKIVTGDEKVRT
jgi:hypothetical protein